MEIIKVGKEKPPRKKSCHKCKTRFTFVHSDINCDRDGRYVICPKCGSFIAVGIN